MTRILHTADLHYRTVDRHSRPDPATGIPSALLSVDRCFGRAVDIALDRGVDAMVISGDAFDVRNPDALTLNLFASQLRRLDGIPTVILLGNHDGPKRPGEPSILELFHNPPEVYVSTRPEVVHLGDLSVATLPWVSRAQLMASRPELSREAVELQLLEALVAVLGMLRHEAPEGSVLALHWSVQGAVLSSEADISLIPEQVIPVPELNGPWSYVAAGHIHRAQELDSRPGWYAGSIDRRNFGEEGETKVALEVDLDPEGGGVAVIPHELPARTFTTLEWKGDGYEPEPQPALVEGAIVRVRGTLSEDLAAKVDQAAIQRALLQDGAHSVTVEFDVERPDRRRDPGLTEELDEVAVLERALDSRVTDEDKRSAIRDLAKELMGG